MTRKNTVVRPDVHDALVVLGQQIKLARRSRGWSVIDTAARVGVSHATFTAIERGAPGTTIGSVFNAASILGVPLFSTDDPVELARLRRSGERDLGVVKSVRSRAAHQSKVKVDGFPD
jgi:transcriptional regulator with XRE-family HTH domain